MGSEATGESLDNRRVRLVVAVARPAPPSRWGAARCHPMPAAPQQAPSSGSWPADALPLAQQLHRSLSIGDREWHAFKAQRPRRGAEQIAAALVQLLARDSPTNAAAGGSRQQTIALLENALAWLKAEISDPGCPTHGR